MNTLRFALGSLMSLAQTLRSHFVCGLCCSPAHPSCHAGLSWHRGCCEFYACRTNFSESQRWSLSARGRVRGGLGHLPWCQDPCWGSQGFCSAGTFSPVVPEQLWVCRCWRGKEVCVSLVMAVLWLFAVSFVGCCPNRKANYFVYAELIMSEQSAFLCL